MSERRGLFHTHVILRRIRDILESYLSPSSSSHASSSRSQCDELVRSLGITLNHHQLIECYMVLGGVLYYWTHPRKGLSPRQNIDAMFFAHEAPLREEFDCLFSSLFRYPAHHLTIVEALGTHTKRLSGLESCLGPKPKSVRGPVLPDRAPTAAWKAEQSAMSTVVKQRFWQIGPDA